MFNEFKQAFNELKWDIKALVYILLIDIGIVLLSFIVGTVTHNLINGAGIFILGAIINVPIIFILAIAAKWR